MNLKCASIIHCEHCAFSFKAAAALRHCTVCVKKRIKFHALITMREHKAEAQNSNNCIEGSSFLTKTKNIYVCYKILFYLVAGSFGCLWSGGLWLLVRWTTPGYQKCLCFSTWQSRPNVLILQHCFLHCRL